MALHSAIHSSVSIDLCFFHFIFICSIILFLSFPALCLGNAFRCGSGGGFSHQNPPTQLWQWHSTHICARVHGRKHKPVAFKKAEGQTRRRWGEKEWNNQIFRLQHSLVLTLEDSVISQTDSQTGGRNAGECGRNVNERVHLSFCPGIAHNICGIFLYGRAHAPRTDSNSAAPVWARQKMWQMWHFRQTVPACPRARRYWEWRKAFAALRSAVGL